MKRWYGKAAIVTGASSGIGESIAEALVKAGMQVVGLARRSELVEANATKYAHYKGSLYAVQCDMTNEEEILRAFEWTTKNVGIVHVLVNNAGVLLPTNLMAGDTEKWRRELETNVLGLCIAQREALQIMTAFNVNGHILNINSLSGQGHIYFPAEGLYGASKHAVTNITDLLRQELTVNGLSIKVTSISPGIVKTDMISDEAFPPIPGHPMPMMECKDVAEACIYALGTAPNVMINEITMRPIGSPF